MFPSAVLISQALMARTLIELIFLAFAVVISMILHECAHGYVALLNGDPTAKLSGRLTLNPVAHFDLLGFAMLITVGFGYARPVPVNPYNFKNKRYGTFTVAIAGISVNLILAFFSSGLWMLMGFLCRVFPDVAHVFNGFSIFFTLMTVLNLNLVFFNLLPIHPLDGFRVVESFTKFSNPYTKFIRDYGKYILLGLIVLGVFVDFVMRSTDVGPGFAALDILGTYISVMTGLTTQGFTSFWGLIFG